MKSTPCSLFFYCATSTPISAALLFMVPAIAIAQMPSAPSAQPVAATSPTSEGTTTSTAPATATPPLANPQPTPTPTAIAQPTGTTITETTPPAAQTTTVPTPVPIYIPVATPPGSYPGVAYPQGAYPPNLYPQATYSAPYAATMPVAPSGGFSVQVTTQIGIPGQATYPVMGAPIQVAPPGINVNQGTYPAGVGNQVGYPIAPAQWGYGVPGYPGASYPGASYPGTYPSSPLPNAAPVINAGSSEAIANPALLPPLAQALWQQVATNTTSRLDGTTLEALRQFVRSYPQFLPGHLRLAQALVANEQTQEAISVLEQATALYPNQPELTRSLIAALSSSNRQTEAVLLARQFALKNPNSPLAAEFSKLATEFATPTATTSTLSTARRTLLNTALSTGLGYLLTGKLSTPSLTSILPGVGLTNQTSSSQMEKDLLSQVQLVNDADVVNYVREVGRKLAIAGGNINPEFYVVNDRDGNAIALPGNKIYVSAGAIANTDSEAALASVLARQMGHLMLSHPSRLEKRSNTTNTIAKMLPVVGGLISPKLNSRGNGLVGTVASGLVGNLISNVLKPNYTTSMIREADAAGAKLLQTAGYSQNSLINISSNSRHSQVKARVQQLLGIATNPWWSIGR